MNEELELPKYQGQSYDLVYLEESTKLSEGQIKTLSEDNKLKKEILRLTSEKISRNRMSRILQVSKERLYRLLRQLIQEGHNLNLEKTSSEINQNDFLEDGFLNKMMNYKITSLQYLILEENKFMKRTELAKKINIPKIALNFILNKNK